MEQRLNKVLEAAIRAPSGDNAQPWRFKVANENRKIDIYNVPERDPSYLNYKQLASYVAHGALIENIVIAARTVALKVNLSLFPDKENENHVATISLEESTPKLDPLYDAIFQRVTNRNPFKPDPLTEDQLQSLRNVGGTISGANVTLISEAKIKNSLAWHLRRNDQFIFEHQEAHDFLFKQIRWNKDDADDSSDGMPIDNLGLGLLERPFFPLLRYWSAVKFLNVLGLSRVIGFKGGLNCRSSAVLGMISVVGANGREAFLSGGRAAQRVWLESTRQGLSFQPVTGLTFLIQRAQSGELTGFNEKQRSAIEDVYQKLDAAFEIKDKIAVFGFRIGKCDVSPVLTRRRSVNEVM